MRIGRLLAASAIATVSTLLIGSAAHAATVTLNPDHVGDGAGPPTQQQCTGPLASPPAPTGWDGWHFVLPNSSGDSFTSVTIVFSGGVTATITSTNSGAPSTGPGFSGFLDNAGADEKHAYIFTTPVGQTIVSGTAEVTGTGVHLFFNLSHGCVGTPPPPMTPPPPPPPGMPTTPPPSVTPAPSGGAGTGGGGSHAFTLAGIGALALASGAGVVLYLIRRRDELA